MPGLREFTPPTGETADVGTRALLYVPCVTHAIIVLLAVLGVIAQVLAGLLIVVVLLRLLLSPEGMHLRRHAEQEG